MNTVPSIMLSLVKHKFATVLVLLTIVFSLISLMTNAADTNESLLTKYIQSKGDGIIAFDASNIKQFWIDNSVVSKKDSFEILLNESNTKSFESIPLKIQLANVNESQDCKIEVIAETRDYSFSVLDEQSKILSASKKENDFLDYSIASSVFHLEDTQKFSFYLKFNSKTTDILSVKKIILSFLNNKESRFVFSPGTIDYTSKDISTYSKVSEVDSNSFSVTGKRTVIFSTKSFFTLDNTFSCSIKIKNIGEESTTILIGYACYDKDHVWMDRKYYPYQDINKVLNVITSSEGSDKVIVDEYTEWTKNCCLALNAKDDMSDIPNKQLTEERILEIKKLENGHSEITLDKPLKSKIQEGTKVRVHGLGGSYLYTGAQILQPEEEQVFTSTIQKDDSFLQYSPKAFSKGVYYVVPVVLSYSTDSSKENTILISDYSINY